MTMDIKFRRDLFGLHIEVNSPQGAFTLMPLEDSNLDQRWRKRFHGSVFCYRNPKCSKDNIEALVRGLDQLSGTWNIKLAPNAQRDDFYAILKLGDFNDAQMWAWQGVENWQKWSQQEEVEYQREQKQPGHKLSKDGKSVRVKVTVERLGDSDPD